MRHLIMTTVLLASIDISLAVAQTANSKASSAGNTQPQTREAPVGHRQPRQSDILSERNLAEQNTLLDRENAELNRRLKSICRGC